jgi:hypothetical protein
MTSAAKSVIAQHVAAIAVNTDPRMKRVAVAYDHTDNGDTHMFRRLITRHPHLRGMISCAGVLVGAGNRERVRRSSPSARTIQLTQRGRDSLAFHADLADDSTVAVA